MKWECNLEQGTLGSRYDSRSQNSFRERYLWVELELNHVTDGGNDGRRTECEFTTLANRDNVHLRALGTDYSGQREKRSNDLESHFRRSVVKISRDLDRTDVSRKR